MNTQQIPAGWHPDPTGRFERRYWGGADWTEHVWLRGMQSVDEQPVSAHISQTTGERLEEPLEVATPAVEAAHPVPSRLSAKTKVPFFGARKAARSALEEGERLQGLIDQYGLTELAERDAAIRELEAKTITAGQQLAKVIAAREAAEAEKLKIDAEVLDLRATSSIQEFGLYDFEHPAETSVSLATQLELLRSQIKQAVSTGTATSATTNFTFNNSSAKGAKFVRDMSKLMLRSYNAEAENGIKTVRAGNLATAQKRLSTAVEQVARLGTMINLRITPSFHALRLRELELASRHLQALQAEKELERERREELRQQRLAEQELARERERLEKERKHYSNVLATLVANGDLEGAERIRVQLNDVDRAIEDVDYRAANIRAGYVYVISNVGSFGPDVVKIGMTRRLEPMDRVNELGDASVPFRFDVHALFFAEDAVAIENTLHKHFADRRLNRINTRREYFRATPADVLDALTEHKVEILEYTVEPAAIEYRSSLPRETTH